MRPLLRLLPLAASLLATPLAAQILRGKVLDAATGAGVSAAAVRALSSEGRDVGHGRTAADGTFSFQLRVPATVHIEAQRTGYRPTVTGELPVGLHETVGVEVKLSAQAIAIEPLRVTARVQPPRRRSLELNGFYDRERRGFGEFLRREEIERHGRSNLAQVLSYVPGTAVLRRGMHDYIYFPRNGGPGLGRVRSSGGRAPARWGPPANSCLPRLFVDRVRVAYDIDNDINSVVDPEQVEAVELFRGPSEIPAEYNDNNSQCGVILIWTRTEP